ncbi:BRAP2 RING ZnF UBP domain-containing protein 2 [Mercurialis annua]|uniref:BRAP2 RING ZnF UBP domain-containing protein 2 n=1 Tax=Mercurialis annua TaxID=3986 RepID=UPI00215FB724|nr:BRAP2 RING ZnF UBP domain-containing protein 2 [Mercurialis annua]XP_050233629.1 BRAP2 RING ZnF UBP domain-containing protein 2 [Mercurialis annua]
MSPSSSATPLTSSENQFRQPETSISGGVDYNDPTSSTPSSSSSLSPMTQAVHFSSGNPRIEETRGVMHLFSNDTPSNLPVGRKPLVCVIGVPNHMTYADFCQFCASFIHLISEMRIVRNDGVDDRYCVLMRFDSQDSSDKFYQHFNGRQFNSLEEDLCRVLFTVDVQFTGYSGSLDSQPSTASTTEQPSCPVCLERLDQDMGGILTTICNHSFHCSCISKWTDSSCPVCRYCQQQPEKSTCFVCQTSENLWLCMLCGFVGCGRYKEEHAIIHWKETQHCYSLELETQRVWNYVGDNYVHRLILSKTDGKLVELNSHCVHANDCCEGCECVNGGISEALLNSKVEVIVNEYNELLAAQLETQKLYYETLLQEVKEDTERDKLEAVKKVVPQRLQKLQSKLDRCLKEKKFLDEVNENLMKNQEIWKAKVLEIEEREKKVLKGKDDKIQDLEEQLRDLMVHLEAGKPAEQVSVSNEIKEGDVLPISIETSSKTNSQRSKKANNRRKN